MSDRSHIRLERDGPVAVVTIDNPPVKAMSFRDYDDLRHRFHEIAGKSATAIRLAKQGLNRIETMTLKEAYEYECTLTAEVRRTPEAGENARAFLAGCGPTPETL